MNAMKYKGYTARMEFDAEDNILVGKVLGVEDIIVFHAESVHEFQAAFHTAIDGLYRSEREVEPEARKAGQWPPDAARQSKGSRGSAPQGRP
jgi:predicted HicB family RNase H-like nuclease